MHLQSCIQKETNVKKIAFNKERKRERNLNSLRLNDEMNVYRRSPPCAHIIKFESENWRMQIYKTNVDPCAISTEKFCSLNLNIENSRLFV